MVALRIALASADGQLSRSLSQYCFLIDTRLIRETGGVRPRGA
jgi:hypothetical protein